MTKTIVGIILYKSDIELLLKNIRTLARSDTQFILLDNANDYSKTELFSKLPNELKDKIHYVENDNIGFGKGHNKIFSIAKDKFEFDYYLCCNPDGTAKHDMLDKLTLFAKSHDDKGIFEAIQFPLEHPKTYNFDTKQTPWCSGACLLIPKKIYEELNGFDDDFFMYMEDVDFSWRCQQTGYKCYIVDNALFSHNIDDKDRDLSRQSKLMFESAYLMGRKYQNHKFMKKFMKKFKEFATDEEIENLKNRFVKINKNHKFTDFSHNLYFAKGRF